MVGRIPQTFIDELLARVDIVDVIDARVPLTKAGRDHKARCPFHEERTPSFTVSQGKQFYHCFGCGAHGTAITFLMDYAHMDFREAVEDLASQAGLTLPQTPGTESAPTSGSRELLDVLARADAFFRAQLRQHADAEAAIAFLKGRGVTGAVAAQFGLGFAPEGWDNLLRALGKDAPACALLEKAGLLVRKDAGGHYDRFRHRIMFPIEDHRGRVVGFGGRVIGEGEPKYLNSPETPVFHKGSELYGLHRARGAIRSAGRALVVEGYMDVLALAQHGLDNAVATLGTATTATHLERLFRHAPALVFCFDGDRAGREAAWRALETTLPAMHDGRQVGFLFLDEGEDPDSFVRKAGAEAFRERLQAATPLPDFLIARLEGQTDLTRLDGRARLVELAKPHLARLPHGVLRDLIVDRLAQRAGAARRAVASHVGPARPPGGGAAEPAARRRRAARGGRQGRLSPVATAVSLLVQNPEFGGLRADLPALRALERPGVGLLIDLALVLEAHPQLTTAALIERFRHTPDAAHLEKLAVWEHFLDQDDLRGEFVKTVELLHEQLLEQEHEQLSRKAERGELDERDKLCFRDLQQRLQKSRESRLN